MAEGHDTTAIRKRIIDSASQVDMVSGIISTLTGDIARIAHQIESHGSSMRESERKPTVSKVNTQVEIARALERKELSSQLERLEKLRDVIEKRKADGWKEAIVEAERRIREIRKILHKD
ncbi:MAG: hypothetical protein AABX02_02285 [archaeon]